MIGITHDVIARGVDCRLRDADAELGRLRAVLDGSDISATLQRGFALLSGPSGRLLRSRAEVLAASELTITVADGTLKAVPLAATPTA